MSKLCMCVCVSLTCVCTLYVSTYPSGEWVNLAIVCFGLTLVYMNILTVPTAIDILFLFL